MKVGTDGVLLGSWTNCKNSINILDIGCGTGLLLLMLAQRNLHSRIIGIEIDAISAREAQLNVNNSNWENRIQIINISLQNFITKKKFDLIVSNPPFFPPNNSENRRDIARRSNALNFQELIYNTSRLLSLKGTFCIIIPKYYESYFCAICNEYKLYCNRICKIKGRANKEFKRVLMEFSFTKSKIKENHLIIEKSRHKYTKEYIDLCKDFYLEM